MHLNSKTNSKNLKESDILDSKVLICMGCDKKLGQVLVFSGEKINIENNKEYILDTIKAICSCGTESFKFTFDGRIKYDSFFEIKEQYIDKNIIMVEYENNIYDR